MNFPLFIARKINGNEDKGRKVSKPAIRIATLGVAIGLAVMIVSVCVVLGFKHTIRDKVVGFGSHITVANFNSFQRSENYPIVVNDSVKRALMETQGVHHVQRYAYTQGILKTDDDFLGVMLKGVGSDFDSTFIHQNMVAGSIPAFSDVKSQQKILLSKAIAEKLDLKVGDRIYAYFVNEQGVRTRRFTISGIYETNLKQFDSQICFTDLYTTNKLNGWQPEQCSGAEVQVNDFEQLDAVALNILNKVKGKTDRYGDSYSTATIMEQNPQIFSWLDLMDLNVWIILALMVSVAGVTMISGLLIIILERTQMIGIMKAMGTKNAQIRHIFLWFATFIIGKGLLWGNLVGLGLVFLQKYTGLVTLDPKTYYVSTVPVELNVLLILALNLATLLICVFVLIAPSYLISHIHPAKTMHYE
ncbi:ABC transporter, permease protein [Prevotella intermedia]|uniref:ABC transporter, permease protein n=1 Tax=Prevotella intermedia TaxID=28131 RepID=A0AAD1F7E1_PREIN|nr:ABC transporter permease [Prevotella intermedia]AFJ08580.1 MacB-like periplasmic core domain protein [Prevotella intermedia 17]APW34208.1 ABC transporter permease [Prevotella intermedia]BAR96138.1 ABC transporter, permease protein [Prevotella intermedia]